MWPDLDGVAVSEQVRRWLVEVWADTRVAVAVTTASPALAMRVQQIIDGEKPLRATRARRVALSLARYLVRMRGRPTPFGLFAGVAALRFADGVAADWAPETEWVRTRAHSAWLARIIALLEADPELRHRLPVMWNDQATVCGERLLVRWQPHGNDPAQAPSAEVSLRLTPAVRIVAEQTASPIVVADLAGKVTAEVPDASVRAIKALLARLIAGGVLITALRPPSTCRDGLAYLLDRLAEVDAAEITGLAPLLRDLADVAALLETGQAEAGARMLRLAEVDHPVTVDLRAGCEVVLPPQVAEEAAAAMSALVRLTPHAAGVPGWRAYHGAFLSRYGAGALVPIRTLIDPVAGLGFPDHFIELPRDLPALLTSRDTRLLRLAQQAALDGTREVILDEMFLDGLHDGDPDKLRIPPHLELCVQVCAASRDALASGDFRLMVSGVSRTGVALAGRFLDLLSEPDQRHRRMVYQALPTGVSGAIPAQLSFPPIHPHLENVVRSPRLLPELVTVAEYRPDGDGRLPLDDLAVTADNHGMYVVSLSRKRVVEPVLANAAARHVMPPVVRLLFEIPRALSAPSSPFAWGTARCLPFLPRVVYGRTVLSPARWSIPDADLPAPNADDARWRAEFTRLRERLALPDTISVGDSDLRLRLNLDEAMDLAVLRDFLDRRAEGKPVVIAESSTPADHGWFAGRAHEVIVPLASTRPTAPAPAVLARLGELPITCPDHGILPGGRILLAKLYTDPRVIDTILTVHLPELLAAWPEPPRWWFIRYRDPDPHLRLRLHSNDGAREAFTRLSTWAAGLRDRGLIRDLVFDTHHPETARYGDGEAHTDAETFFAADSVAVLAQLTTERTGRDVPPQALLAAGMINLVTSLTGGVPAGMRWLIDHGDIGPATPPGRDILRHAIRLADDPDMIATLPGGTDIVKAWRARVEAAHAYRHHLEDGALRPVPVIRSLLHMHHIRARGIDPDDERAIHRLARAVALGWASRHGDHTP